MFDFIKQYLTTIVAALTIMGLAYLIFWILLRNKLAKKKIQLSKRAGWSQIKGEIGATMLSFIGGTGFSVLLLSYNEMGLTKFYLNAGTHGLWYEVLVVFIMLIVSDTWFYWSHRAMHHQSIYKYVHALHHRSLDVNPFTSSSFHIIESLWLTAWVLPLAMVLPISMSALGIMQVIGTLNNLKSHLGYELFPKMFSKPPFNLLINATNHSLHHTQYRGNYGLFFRFWDMACGTELNDTKSTFNEIHSRKTATIIDNTKYRTLIIDKITNETPQTVSVYFKPTDNAFYDYLAGQYLTLKVKIGGKTHHRCFSLSSSPNIDNFLRITVKLKGDVSHYFHQNAKIGDPVESLLPVGDFTFSPQPTIEKHYVMVAGGSGITPLFSMMMQMLKFEPQNKVTLLYANKTAENIIFKSQLKQLAMTYPNFEYIDILSGNKRIEQADLNKGGNTHFYICGPDAFMCAISQHLKDLNIPKSHVNSEHFADGYKPWFGLPFPAKAHYIKSFTNQ